MQKENPFFSEKKRLLESAKMICATVSIIYDMPKSEMHFYRIKVKRMYLKILCTQSLRSMRFFSGLYYYLRMKLLF